jgi:hypothetical protein
MRYFACRGAYKCWVTSPLGMNGIVLTDVKRARH